MKYNRAAFIKYFAIKYFVEDPHDPAQKIVSTDNGLMDGILLILSLNNPVIREIILLCF